MSPIHLILSLLYLLSSVEGGCLFLRDERTVRCQNATLTDIGESLHVLTRVVRNRPHTVEVEDCFGDSLPATTFEDLASSIETVRVRRSALKRVEDGAFFPLFATLRELDLSHNDLEEVPGMLVKMKVLEHLRLQHNRIVFLRPNSLPHGLRELNLGHNHIGLDAAQMNNGYTLKGSIPLSDFSVGEAAGSLESLVLRGNRLAAVPDQLQLSDLPQLLHLDLSENVIEGLASSLLPPGIEFLDLHSNRIQGLSPLSSLKYLDLTENPFHCDCGALWLHESAVNDSTTILLPTCHSPEHLKGQSLEEVPWTIECPHQGNTTRFHYKTRGGSDYDVVRLASTSPTSVNIQWRGRDRQGSPKWTIVYRREGDPPHQMTLVPRSDNTRPTGDLLTQTITGLRPGTKYVVCVALVHDSTKYTIEPGKCGRVSTLDFGADIIQTGVEEISPSASAVTVRWRLSASGLSDGISYRHEWTIRVRRTGSDNYTDIPVYDITSAADTDGQLYEYSVGDLATRTHYDVCLVDVEHRPVGTVADVTTVVNADAATCVTVQTSSVGQLLYASEIAAIVFACVLCLVVSGATIALCHQRGLLRWRRPLIRRRHKEFSTRPPSVTTPPVEVEKLAGRHYIGSWNSLRLPDFGHLDRPEFRSFRTMGYRDALTSVTIYRSGYSEC